MSIGLTPSWPSPMRIVPIMRYDNWMQRTDAGIGFRRSAELKNVDTALLNYDKSSTPQNRENLTAALLVYIQSEGADWAKSRRNKFNAISDLKDQVLGVTGPAPGKEDVGALLLLREESRAVVTTLFRGKQLELRPGFWAKIEAAPASRPMVIFDGGSAVADVNTVSGGAVAGGMQAAGVKLANAMGVDELLRDLAEEYFEEVKAILLAAFIGNASAFAEFAAAVTPWLGLGVKGVTTLKSTFGLVKSKIRTVQAARHVERSLSINEPEKAFKGLLVILQRELDDAKRKAVMDTADLSASLAMSLVDGGAVSTSAMSLGFQVLKLTLFIQDIVLDLKEKNAANKHMANRVIVTSEIFTDCPIIGAYMVCCVPTSVLVNSVFDRFFDRGWRGDVEYAVREHIAPLKEQARRVITAHRFWIRDLQDFPNIKQSNFVGLQEMARRAGKNGMVGISWDEKPSAPRVEWPRLA